MKYKTIIVDDEPLARKVLREYLESIVDFHLLEEMKSAEEVQDWLLNHSVDLIFLDINLPRLSGLDLIRKIGEKPLIIFTTAYPQYAVQAFEVEAFDYLLKPINRERFEASLQKARKYLNANLAGETSSKWINLKEGRRIYRVDKDEILYLQAYGDYVRVYTLDKTYMVKERLQQFVRKLSGDFLQIHRSYAINLGSIDFFEGNTVSIKSELLPVSESYREDLRLAIRDE